MMGPSGTSEAQMEQHPAAPIDTGIVVPLRATGEPPLPLDELVEQALRIGVGLVTLSADVLAEAVARSMGRSTAASGAEPAPPSAGLPLLAGAVFGTAIGAVRWGARAATTLLRTGELVLSPVTTSVPFRDGMRRLSAELDALGARWREERPREEEAAQAFVRLLVPQVVEAVLDQVDLDRVVAERVDVDRIVEGVDLDAVVARLDLDALIDRVDVDRILDRVDLRAVVDRLPLEEIVAKIDVDEIVARVDLDRVVDRIDVDAVASRLDVDAVVHRLDLTAIAREVIDELDLPEIIRESMGSMTTETVGGIRVQSMNADRMIARLVDRILQRRPTDRDPETPD
jgi:hypothetical protein